jgi:cytochrome c-type biogenesis protein CcmH
MIVFWLICTVLVAIALAFVVPPLLNSGDTTANTDSDVNVDVYRDQLAELQADLSNGIVSNQQFELDREEIERRLLEDVPASNAHAAEKRSSRDRRLVYAVSAAIPLLAVVLYTQIGNSAAVVQSPNVSGSPSIADGQMTQQRIESNVASLARRLEQNPNDVQGWTMLGRSYLSLEKYPEASNAFAKATTLKTDDADLWADYAFALAMANGRQLQGQPEELIAKALQIDPENGKALELAGSAAFESKNYSEAIKYWERLLEKSPQDSELTQALTERINQAKSLSNRTK